MLDRDDGRSMVKSSSPGYDYAVHCAQRSKAFHHRILACGDVTKRNSAILKHVSSCLNSFCSDLASFGTPALDCWLHRPEMFECYATRLQPDAEPKVRRLVTCLISRMRTSLCLGSPTSTCCLNRMISRCQGYRHLSITRLYAESFPSAVLLMLITYARWTCLWIRAMIPTMVT